MGQGLLVLFFNSSKFVDIVRGLNVYRINHNNARDKLSCINKVSSLRYCLVARGAFNQRA